MRTFLLKITVFSILILILIAFVTKQFSLHTEKRSFNNYNSESNLFLIEKNKPYDYLLMGISHARNFSRHKNHLITEKHLQGSILNFGTGGGKGGVVAQYTYLKHFYSRGNRASKIFYIPSPPMMFSEYLDNNTALLLDEPFRTDFFFQYLTSASEKKMSILYRYLRSKYTKAWLNLHPWTNDSVATVLEKIDTSIINNGFKAAYPNGLDLDYFIHTQKVIIKTIELALENESQIAFLITPAVFGKWPGHAEIVAFLIELQKTYPIEVYDLSETCKNREYYYDHHHLNTRGVRWFLENYMAPICNK